jgi:hypothetical protein
VTSLLVLLRALLVLVASLVWSDDALAYAWMIRHGYGGCASCHTDPSGGEGLTQMGRVQSELSLSQPWSPNPPLTSAAKAAYALDEPDWLRLGGSARMMTILSLPDTNRQSELRAFPMQLDVYATMGLGSLRAGVSVGYAKIPAQSPHLRAAQVFQSESGSNLLSRSHWLGWAFGDWWLLRAGRLNLPFGVRTSEHVLWVREATLTDRESDQQHGVALAHWGPNWRWELMGVMGNLQVQPDAVRERGYVGYLEHRPSPSAALGLSSEWLYSQQSINAGRTEPTHRHAHGLTLRWAWVRELAILAEANMLSSSGRELGHVEQLTVDYEPVQGLHLAVTEEALDAGRVVGQSSTLGGGRLTTGTWLSVLWFPAPHWDLRVDFVARQAATPTLQAQLHFYL